MQNHTHLSKNYLRKIQLAFALKKIVNKESHPVHTKYSDNKPNIFPKTSI